MPLSDHEQRLLDEIEQALYAEDPKFVSSVRSVRAHSTRRRSLLWGGLGTLVGVGLVLVGLIASIIALSVVGFVLVVGSVGLAIQSLRRPQSVSVGRGGSTRSSKRPASSKHGLRARMEERINRRFDSGF
jgi:hypothetical protein